jgi:hypothetical protein
MVREHHLLTIIQFPKSLIRKIAAFRAREVELHKQNTQSGTSYRSALWDWCVGERKGCEVDGQKLMLK